jgi:hypothetical protein
VNHHGDIEEEDEEFEEVTAPPEGVVVRSDKASRLLGIRHQRSMVSLSLSLSRLSSTCPKKLSSLPVSR